MVVGPFRQSMKAIALPMVLLMLTATLAGCTGGDPDGGDGTDGIDVETLNQLIEDNLEDFLNNTSVTVNQDFHYYNNTTYVIDDSEYVTNNEFQNTTNIDGGEITNNYEQNDNSNTSYQLGGATFGTGVNGTISGSNMMFVAHIEFTAMDLFPDYETIDYRNNTFSYNWTYYDYLTNSERTDIFSFNCQVYYLIGSLSNGSTFQVSYWEMVANGSGGDNYWNAWDNEYNSTIADMLANAGSDHTVRSICDENYIAAMPIKDGTDGWQYNFLSIDIPQGYAIEYLQLNSEHSYYGCSSWLSSQSCTDSSYHYQIGVQDFYNYSEGVHPGYQNWYYGGWDNITIDFDMKFNRCDDADGSYDHSYCRYSPAQNPDGPNHYYSAYWGSGYGYYSMWPTSVYEFTLYYQFVPVVPIE